ncbi:DUF3757 domain-containing protein [Pandoraea sp. NPDC087047]|uniref:DUF3757 domain-containing protein n=1 Tax=Pandoraea sp. NPDC087047 TaxID=3364390 RepID=UPI0037F87441
MNQIFVMKSIAVMALTVVALPSQAATSTQIQHCPSLSDFKEADEDFRKPLVGTEGEWRAIKRKGAPITRFVEALAITDGSGVRFQKCTYQMSGGAPLDVHYAPGSDEFKGRFVKLPLDQPAPWIKEDGPWGLIAYVCKGENHAPEKCTFTPDKALPDF